MKKKSESEKQHYKTREEEVYWNHFHVMHFYQILPKHFHDHLVLPTKFAEKMKAKMPDKVSLIGPCGSVWEVDVMKIGNLAFVGDGWKAFARTYELKENFLLLFKYIKDSSFEVLIFDGKSLCEQETAYFVKKITLRSPSFRNNVKRASSENSSTEVMEFVDDDDSLEFVSTKPMQNIIQQLDLMDARNNTEDSRTENVVEEQGGERSPKSRKTLMSDDSAKFGSKPRLTIPESSSRSKPVAAVENDRNDPNFHITNEPAENIVGVLSEERRSPNTQTRLVSGDAAAAAEGRGKPTATMPCKPPSKFKPRTKKPGGNKTAKKLSHVSVRDPITEGNGDTEIVTPDTGKCPIVLNHSASTSKKRSRSVKHASPKSARKLTFRSVSGGKRLSKEYRSNRRPVTDSEKEDALRLATQKLSENSFLVVMRPSSVYKRFYLTIPAGWMRKYMARRHQEMTLRMGEKTWLTVFHQYRNKGSSGGLATGWKKFALDNNLEEFDVCLFSLASEENDSVLDVEIFRVIPEIVPPNPVICSI